jgi:tRNA-2-methylthio-N6-dimethylallyladenosine synthase
MKFFIETIGCQQNEYDASRLSFFLKSSGFVESQAEEAEVIFILACSVRQTAIDRIFGRVRNWASSKKVIITSCLTPDDQKKMKDRGAYYWKMDDVSSLEKILAVSFSENKMSENSDSVYVPIMTGCNNFCAYCIVPYTRGRETSRPSENVIKEVSALIRSGKKQVVLLGQNVNSYKFGFAELLTKINQLPGDFEISFMSNHPKDMSVELINAVATLSKVKKEIHLPLQSGSDKILKAMNRPYAAEEYLRLVESLKSKVPKVKLTTDIIVGFSGETEEDFQQTVEVCKKVGYSLAYVNKYSPRKGTASYKLGDPIPWNEKQRRWKILNDLINKK